MYTSGSTGNPKGVDVPTASRSGWSRDGLRPVRPGRGLPADGAARLRRLDLRDLGRAAPRRAPVVLPAGAVPTSPSSGDRSAARGDDAVAHRRPLPPGRRGGVGFAAPAPRSCSSGGESCSAPTSRGRCRALPRRRLVNGYGPTESTTFTCCLRCDSGARSATRSRSAGRSPTRACYVLDRAAASRCRSASRASSTSAATASRGAISNRPGADRRAVRAGPVRRARRAALPDRRPRPLARRRARSSSSAASTTRSRSAASASSRGGRGGARRAPRRTRGRVVAPADRTANRRMVGLRRRRPRHRRAELRLASRRRSCPPYMVPRRSPWRESLPVTPNGKVDRPALADRAARGVGIQSQRRWSRAGRTPGPGRGREGDR